MANLIILLQKCAKTTPFYIYSIEILVCLIKVYIIYKKSIEVFPNVFIFMHFCNEELNIEGKGG